MKKSLSFITLIVALSLPANVQASPFISKSAAKNIAKGAAATASLIVIMHGIKAYWVYYRYQQLPTYKEKINFLIRHKTFLKRLLSVRNCIKSLCGECEPTLKTRLTNWLEQRLMQHLSNKELKSTEDLPFVERQLIKAIDGATHINRRLLDQIEVTVD